MGENELNLENVIKSITCDVKKWKAMCSFSNSVLTIKETDEWKRQKRTRMAEYFGVSESSENSGNPDEGTS